MPDFLGFTLWAPLASMGEIAVGERRTGFDRPAKSAILGLLAAALGIRRDEEERHAALAEGYGLALRTDHAGDILHDYHTAQAPEARKGVRWATRRQELDDPRRLGTILSRREYRCGPWHTVLLWARDGAPHGLGELAAALRVPAFTLAFGRKSCPLGLPPDPKLVPAESISAALSRFDAERGGVEKDLRLRLRLTGSGRLHLDEDGPPLGEGWQVDRAERRRDQPLSRRRWQFGLRVELVASPLVSQEPVP